MYNIMRGACRNVALTCGYAVFSADTTSCPQGTTTSNQDKCIESISEIFYQSLLCPDNSTYDSSGTSTISLNNKDGGWVNKKCRCLDGFVTFNGACLPACENGGLYTSAGVCSDGASCYSIPNAGNASGSDAVDSLFWDGRCACTQDMYFYRNKCRTCPSFSDYVSDRSGDIFDGQCRCQTGFTPSSNRLCCGNSTHVCMAVGDDTIPVEQQLSAN